MPKIPQLVRGQIWDLSSASLVDEGKKELKSAGREERREKHKKKLVPNTSEVTGRIEGFFVPL